ncbi:MAG TPA: ABC transporter ATP-binding protein [Polyangiaceae bacterium]|nr:ABC transporter ATP-binding protein [Polyangiaceae bacterium]
MIEAQDVSKSFGALVALSHVSLSVAAGERVAFVGPNGSGKTTLLRAILGLIRTTGRITIGGIDVAADPAHALRHVAYIPQVAPPADAPVREVVRAIATLRGIDPARIAERAQAFGLSLERCASTRFAHLSGGMKQKLLAAAALAAETPILVGDEPTANLDAEARHVFFEELRSGRDDRIVILCSHRADELAHVAERVVEFREGRIERSAPGPAAGGETSSLRRTPLRAVC